MENKADLSYPWITDITVFFLHRKQVEFKAQCVQRQTKLLRLKPSYLLPFKLFVTSVNTSAFAQTYFNSAIYPYAIGISLLDITSVFGLLGNFEKAPWNLTYRTDRACIVLISYVRLKPWTIFWI